MRNYEVINSDFIFLVIVGANMRTASMFGMHIRAKARSISPTTNSVVEMAAKTILPT